jgi:hypothetical protein
MIVCLNLQEKIALFMYGVHMKNGIFSLLSRTKRVTRQGRLSSTLGAGLA